MNERARRQPTLLAVASAAWLIFISALVLIDYLAWSNRTDPELVDARMALFEGRLDALDERLEKAACWDARAMGAPSAPAPFRALTRTSASTGRCGCWPMGCGN
jgi:hypothetical protein